MAMYKWWGGEIIRKSGTKLKELTNRDQGYYTTLKTIILKQKYKKILYQKFKNACAQGQVAVALPKF